VPPCSKTYSIFIYPIIIAMFRKYLLFMFAALMLALTPSCNHNKIACPTYADSFPEQKAKKKEGPPALPKASKPRLSIMPGGK
jgi:hypothetical protein